MNAVQVSQTSGNNTIQQGSIHEPLGAQTVGAFSARPTFGRSGRLPLKPEGIASLEHYETDMAEFQAEYEEAIKRIKREFILDGDGVAVVEFLNDHRTIPQILLESVEPLRQAFQTSVNLTLRAPIEDGARHMLYVIVPWSGTVSDARAALSRFDESWWLARAYQASGYLTFNYELI